jgi:hypothetical protein
MPPERRALVGAVGAVAVVTLALAVILGFGQLRYPEFPTLAEDPNPQIPGTVEFVRWERDGACLYAVPAGGGAEEEVGCGPDVHERRPPGDLRERDGQRLETDGFDGRARVVLRGADGERTTLLEVRGPRDYGFWEAQWSPDGKWVLVVDSVERLLVVPADGGGDARILAEDASAPHWRR